MNLKKGVVLGMVLVLTIFGASAALASSISLSILGGPPLSLSVDTPWSWNSYNPGAEGGSISYEPTTPGLFSQAGPGGGIEFNVVVSGRLIFGEPGPPAPPPGPTTFGVDASGGVTISYGLIQEGPLRFTMASWTATLISGGIETPFFHVDADADLIKNGGTFPLDAFYSLGPFDFPYTWNYDSATGTWVAFGSGGSNGAFRLYMTGTVIDTTVVPLPPTLLLLGSSLGGLAIFGRRKLMG